MRELRLQQVAATEATSTTTALKTPVSSQNNFKNDFTKSNEFPGASPSAPQETTRDWIGAFNTSLLTTRASNLNEKSADLSELMQSPEFASLLVGARHLADTQGLNREEATERLIETFRKIDAAWKEIVMKRGLQSIIDP